ncbi:YtcA family lipoprotein [Proteus myxofaciens]|uniref:Uncharacterized protein YtcA n=1 Tax=Proteus myxofaciens ATCC 19692 TaxID=1354337 RepID=A0A198FDC3_9GAMM|nr:YtcA family lipoprotein [Proteus myxofaciens]OAT22867.1 hypothetical protein M983_2832 [Proteus myxofaciens ATCC 19692]
MNNIKKIIQTVLIIGLLTGCTPAPSIVMFGASFPDWLLCSGIGIIGMVLVHIILSKTKLRFLLHPVLIVYPCITALIAMLTWLAFFPK